jgi:hypothetical protein
MGFALPLHTGLASEASEFLGGMLAASHPHGLASEAYGEFGTLRAAATREGDKICRASQSR